jgi:steroid delta-isomerase-like uncharacterized protein
MRETEVVHAGREIDQAWVEDFAKRWVAAWNSHQPERLLELMTEDIVYDDSAWPTTMRGHGDVRAFLDFAWRAMPDMRFEVVDGPFLIPGQPKAAFYWKGTGTLTGPLDPPGLAPTGARVEFEGADFHDYRDGRVARLRIVFDMLDASRQMGLFPKVGSQAEKAIAAGQRLVVELQERLRR